MPHRGSRVSRLFTTEHDGAIRTGVVTHGAGKWTAIQQGAECLAEFTGATMLVIPLPRQYREGVAE